jgi:hypothetical protein
VALKRPSRGIVFREKQYPQSSLWADQPEAKN